MQKVSVITVVYNDINKIEKTIKNVLKQTYKNLEYVVVDGASTDGTVEVIKKYSGKIKWISEPDKGIYDAMMKGVSIATGEWIIFHNSGDFFSSPSTIEDLFNQYEIDNGEDFLIANSRFYNNIGYVDRCPAILEHSYYDEMPVHHPSTFIRKATQLRYPFHLEYRNSADYCFFVEAFRGGASFRHFNILMTLIDLREGVTVDHYDATLSDNIMFLSKMGASRIRILKLKAERLKWCFTRAIRKTIPFYSYYIRIRSRHFWTEQDVETILADI